MPITKLQNSTCSVSRSLSVLGERWTFLILRDALDGITRFEAFRDSLGIATDVLTDRLNTLVENGVLTKDAYQEPGRRARFEYHLTPVGQELHVVIGALQEWGDVHLPHPGGQSIERRAASSGRPVHVAFVDDRGDEVPVDDIDTIRTANYPTTAGSRQVTC
jgi:DNA-binding HxlR family transcriptional regulator